MTPSVSPMTELDTSALLLMWIATALTKKTTAVAAVNF